MTLLEVVIDGDARLTLDEALTAFEVDGELYLPLGALARLLEFPIAIDPAAGHAEGWFLEPGRSFTLDLADCSVAVEDRAETLRPERLGLRDGEIYVDRPLLQQWFPLDLRPNLSRLMLVVHPREPLPLQRRLQRQGRWSRLRGSDPFVAEIYPVLDVDYRFWDWPFLDATVQARFDRHASGEHQRSTLYKLVGAGDLMKMHAQVSFAGRDDNPVSDAFVTLGRRDPSRGLLGPLNASEYAIGDVATPRDPLIADNALGRGFTLSNAPLDRPQEFDRFSLRGELPLGWDVELYRNDRLIGFQSAGSGDRYDFTGIPLDFGVNRFRLVFYGPQGQIREETLQRVIGPGMVRPGEHLYRLTAVAERDDLELLTQTNSGERVFAGYDFGLTRVLGVGGGIKRLVLDGVARDYLSTHANLALPGAFGRLEYASQDGGGDALAAVLSTRLLGVEVTAETARFDDFASERTQREEVPGMPLSRSEIRLGSHLSGMGAVGLGLGVRFSRNRGTQGERRQTETRLSFNTRRVTATHIFERDSFATQASDTRRALQRLLLSTRRGPVSLRGELVQEIEPLRYVSNVALSADWTFTDRATLRFSANRAPAEDVTTYGAGISWQSKHAAVGANVLGTDEGELMANITVSSSLVRDPTRNQWLTSSNPQAQTGAVAARVFLDNDGDGRWDATEPPVEGAKLRISGRTYQSATGVDGDTFISGLPAYQETAVAVDSDSLDNPFWLADNAGREVVLRPGRTALVQIAVTPTGSIEGATFQRTGEGFRPIANVPVSLLSKDGKLLRESRSAYDGYYYFDSIPPGSYRLRAGLSPRRRDPRDTLVEIDGEIATMGAIDLLDSDSRRLARAQPVAEPLPLPPGNAFTLQLLAVGTESAAQHYIEAQGLQGFATCLVTVVNGKRWYAVVYGAYPSRAQAERALATLPGPLRAAKPWIRRLDGVRELMAEQ